MDKNKITKLLLAITFIAGIFITGLFFGREQNTVEGFVVIPQYEDRAAEREDTPPPDQPSTPPEEYPDTAQEMEVDQAVDVDEEDASDLQFPVNINSATVEELTLLPGVGPAIAERIVAHRETYGEFRMIEELRDVSGIGSARFGAIAELITVY